MAGWSTEVKVKGSHSSGIMTPHFSYMISVGEHDSRRPDPILTNEGSMISAGRVI